MTHESKQTPTNGLRTARGPRPSTRGKVKAKTCRASSVSRAGGLVQGSMSISLGCSAYTPWGPCPYHNNPSLVDERGSVKRRPGLGPGATPRARVCRLREVGTNNFYFFLTLYQRWCGYHTRMAARRARDVDAMDARHGASPRPAANRSGPAGRRHRSLYA